MASRLPNRPAPAKNVVYDSRNDTSTGKKRAVIGTGGASVAERARLFGPQIKAATNKSQPGAPKSNPVPRNQNYQSLNNRTDSKPPANRPADIRPSEEQYSNNDYARFTRPVQQRTPARPSNNNYNRYSTSSQSTIPKYDRPPNTVPTERPQKATYTQVFPEPTHTYDENPYDPPTSPYYSSPNAFQPIRDPLEGLFAPTSSSTTATRSTVDQPNIQAFDLGNLISQIQDDYMQSVRPYVSSVQYVEASPIYERSLADIGYQIPGATRRGYSGIGDGTYQSARYANGSGSYQVLHPRPSKADARYGSMPRRKRQQEYHDRASSPIQVQPVKPATPVQLTTTTTTVSEVDTEDDEVTTATATTKTAEGETEVESTEEETEEEESIAQPPPLPTPKPAATPLVGQPARPPLSTPTKTESKAKKSDTDETVSEDDSDSDSDSDSDDDKKPPARPAARPSPVPTTSTPAGVRNTTPRVPLGAVTGKRAEASEAVPSVDERKSDGFITKTSKWNPFKRFGRKT